MLAFEIAKVAEKINPTLRRVVNMSVPVTIHKNPQVAEVNSGPLLEAMNLYMILVLLVVVDLGVVKPGM